MKKTIVTLCVLLCCNAGVFAQRRCGIAAQKAAMIAKDATWKQRFEEQRSSLQAVADNYAQLSKKNAQRTTDVPTVPVIFHIIVTQHQLDQIGGVSGIETRINSQIAVLNQDYNKANPDGALLPSGWVPLYASTGIHFGLAHTQPSGWNTEGYELKILPGTTGGFFQGSFFSYGDAKHVATGGLDAWDNTKYMNIWCMNFLSDSGLLGTTVPQSFTVGPDPQPNNEIGVVMNYLALGRRASASDIFYGGTEYDLGRTLTHEVGHFFEIWHTWGDDNGFCPWSSGGLDDGLADTPPESDFKYGSPMDTIPGGTINDACKYNGATNEQPIGIATHDFLNYTDDAIMHLFTTDQANAMAAMVLTPPGSGTGANGQGTTGESYSLTQHPELLQWPSGVQQTTVKSSLNISPNPSSGIINITYNAQANVLNSISVLDILGQEVLTVNTSGTQKDVYSIDLSAMSKGIYIVRCNFASGIITRKILLQ